MISYSIIPVKNYYGSPTFQAHKFWKRWHGSGCKSDYAVVVKDNKNIIAFFSFRVKGRKNIIINSNGTWVSAKYRRQGIAKKMWSKAIRKFKPTKFEATIVSRSGRSFSRYIKHTNHKTSFLFWINL